MKALVIFISLYCLGAHSIEPMDNYYSNNILDAVNQAKEKPHHYDYSSTYRYKRTTAQSIELNRLDLEELERTNLTIDGKNTSILKDVKSNEVVSIEKDMAIPSSEKLDISVQHSLPVNSEYHSQIGSHRSTDVINQGQMISTPRP